MNTLNENIVRLRKQAGMTQEELASLLGISAQSVSKWETGVTMPDILLLPILADVFGVQIDALFGKEAKSGGEVSADSAFDAACGRLKRIFAESMHQKEKGASVFESEFAEYERALADDSRMRSAILRENGVLYYREEAGGLLLKRPQNGWASLLRDAEAAKTVALLANEDFCKALYAILDARMPSFTLCRSCEIKDAQALEAAFEESGLFKVQTVRVEEEDVKIYELVCAQRLAVLLAVLCYAKEFAEFEDIFYYYCGCVDFPWA